MINVILKYQNEPMKWHSGLDCMAFLSECHEFFSGINLYKLYANPKSTEEAKQLVKNWGGGVEDILTHFFGEATEDVNQAENGDFLFYDTPWQEYNTIGVVFMGRTIVRTLTGITDWPIELAQKRWSRRKFEDKGDKLWA